MGNIPPTFGRLRVLGFSIPARARQMRSKIGIVPQVDNLDPDFTVISNFKVCGQHFGLKRGEINAPIPFLLSLAALEDKARINQLSGGIRRRLSIARALINRPKLLILDEPATELDPQIRQNIWQMLRQLQKDGLTIILTTHYIDEAERLCSRIILMDHGRIPTDQTAGRLIQECIEPGVLEVYGDDVFSWHRSLPLQEDIRFEQVGETFFHYSENLECLVRSLDERVGIRYSYRPSNLEDVFLKLTGGSYETIDALCLWVAVWRRNALVWRKSIRTALLGGFAEPIFYLFALGYGLGGLYREN